MATFRTYAEVLRPDHPMMKNYKASSTWRPSAHRPAVIDQAMRAEPGVVLYLAVTRQKARTPAGHPTRNRAALDLLVVAWYSAG